MPEWNPRANDIFAQAAEIDAPADRRLFVGQQCGADAALRAQVESLLGAGGKVGSFLERPAVPAPPPGDETAAYRPLTEGPGTVVGPYKLLQHIGEGGFGAVYMAEQERPVRRKVALKVIKPGMDTREVIARFESERQALAMMEHPNIARVFDAGATESGRPYFVMELVKGVPITEFCDRNRLPAEQRLRLFVTVCNAIQHAHHKGIIHRDVKPSNVMVTLHDGVPVVKVIDFGVAKATAQKLTERTLFTAYGQMVGTPAYMSPEQAEMSGLDIDTRSDIFSLGVLLYELLTGTTPLDSARLRRAGYAEMQRLIREEEAPRPSTRLSSMGGEATVLAANRGTDVKRLSQLLRSDLDWVVMKSPEKDRTRRYGSLPSNGIVRGSFRTEPRSTPVRQTRRARCNDRKSFRNDWPATPDTNTNSKVCEASARLTADRGRSCTPFLDAALGTSPHRAARRGGPNWLLGCTGPAGPIRFTPANPRVYVQTGPLVCQPGTRSRWPCGPHTWRCTAGPTPSSPDAGYTKEQKYPVLYLLHGGGDDETGWTRKGAADVILDNLTADKKLTLIIVVMPNGRGEKPANPFAGFDAFGKDLLEDVIPFAEKTYPVKADREHRALAGLSLGGLQTLDIGLTHLDTFAALGVFSSGWFPDRLVKFEKDNQALLKDPETNKKLTLFWVANGKPDIAYKNNQAVLEMFDKYGLKYEYREGTGGHDWASWKNHLYAFAPLLFQSAK